MQKSRLEALADGIFAIVMTLLIIRINVPELNGSATNGELLDGLRSLTPLFASYILSFLVLATYWMGHNVIISVFAKNLTRKLAYMNVPFFMAVALIPFSAHLLGLYFYTQIAVVVYGINVILIGLFLFLIMAHELRARDIENAKISQHDLKYAYIRVLLPVASAVVAIAVSFYSPVISIYIFVIVVFINLISGSLDFIHTTFLRLIGKK